MNPLGMLVFFYICELLEISLSHQIAVKPGKLAVKIGTSLTCITCVFASNYRNSAFGELAFDVHTSMAGQVG